MTTNEENLSAQESLKLISAMILQAKGNLKQSSFYFLLWGWTIAIANLGVFVMLKFTSVKNPFVMFAITIPAAIVTVFYGMKQDRQGTVNTHLDNINKWLWIGFGITCFILSAFGKQINWQINSIIITTCAVPTFVSGIMLRFKPLIIGGIAFWIFGIVCFLMPVDIQFLLAAVAVVTGYLVPGYILRKSEI